MPTPTDDNNEAHQAPSPPTDDFTVGYRFIDHTADIGVHSRGTTLEESFQHIGLGMTDVLSTNIRTVEQSHSQTILVSDDTLEELVISYLSELLFLFDTEHLLFSSFKVTITRTGEDYNLEALVKGERFDPERHPYPVEIKAVTEHMLTVKTEPPFDITVLFDL